MHNTSCIKSSSALILLLKYVIFPHLMFYDYHYYWRGLDKLYSPASASDALFTVWCTPLKTLVNLYIQYLHRTEPMVSL